MGDDHWTKTWIGHWKLNIFYCTMTTNQNQLRTRSIIGVSLLGLVLWGLMGIYEESTKVQYFQTSHTRTVARHANATNTSLLSATNNITTTNNNTVDLPNNKTALVIRTYMPIRIPVLQHIVQMAHALHYDADQKYSQLLELVILVDETKQNGSEALLRHFFRHMSEAPVPKVDAFTEDSLRADLAPGLEKYVQGPLVNNETNATKIIWSLHAPVFVSFVKRHDYPAAWVFEDDIAVLGKGLAPLVDLVYEWERAVRDQQSTGQIPGPGIVATRLIENGCPFSLWIKEKHTPAFQTILEEMYQTDNFTHWKTLHDDTDPLWNQKRPPGQAQPWVCLSDAVYRHDREVSLYMHEQLQRHGVARFGEGFQQPLVWKGNFTITDLDQLTTELPYAAKDYNDLGLKDLGVKYNLGGMLQLHLREEKPHPFVFHSVVPNLYVEDEQDDDDESSSEDEKR